ncbi:chemotaxis protein CheW [Pandoraea terrae]|uniref:Chemotaxis protein CheW n=1 Tax=Pandoraea terrae TaxID=1537710 RepID=A0A5E4TIU3_9BURK|nr:chemotaxis protein CheW [Pandoraea terrae]VVD86069.1 chemotaxis protein CheW [Pandoraea terrae]
MLFLRFEIGADRYALPVTHVTEVLPQVKLKRLPAAPDWVAGAFSYRGVPVPVIDLAHLATGTPARPRLSTRLVLVPYPAPGPNARCLGVIVERATDTLRADPSAFRDCGIDTPNAAWLGPVFDDPRGLVQWIRVDQLLNDEARAVLFDAAAQSLGDNAELSEHDGTGAAP